MTKKRNFSGMVYSTDPDFVPEEEQFDEQPTLAPSKQHLYISLDTKLKAGKKVTKIDRFIGTSDDLAQLCKQLKSHCACGGAVKEGVILLQGDVKEKCAKEIGRLGYKYKVV